METASVTLSKVETHKEEKFEKLFKDMSLLNFETGSRFYAKPTYVVDPHNFYLIPMPLLYHVALLSKPGQSIQGENLKVNNIVIYKSNNPKVNEYFKIELDDHIRGLIQKVDNDNKYQIYALDRGFIEKDVSIERIYNPANNEALTTPSLIQHCELDLCSPIGSNFGEEAIKWFKRYLGNEKLSVVINGKLGNKLKVVVYNSNPDDIATMLAYADCTYLSSNVAGKEPIKFKINLF